MYSYQKPSSMQGAKAILLLAMMQIAVIYPRAQQRDTGDDSIHVSLDSSKASFNASLRPLRQIAGAPEAFYTYFWEFGDGNFSFEPRPNHIYKDTGSFDVILYATNNYDDGKPPPRRRKKVPVKRKAIYAQQRSPSFFKKDGSIEMRVNRMPKPDEDMVLVLGYRNQGTNPQLDGSLLLFYNERQFTAENFKLEEQRAYHGERTIPLNSISRAGFVIERVEDEMISGPSSGFSPNVADNDEMKLDDLLRSKQQQFSGSNAWRFENLQAGEEKFFFITLHTTPEMIKDTNAVVMLTGMFIPDDPASQLQEYQLELQIVASHDPNRMMLRNRRLNYRFTGSNKEMTYNVRFQNTGKGPASRVSVGVAVPHMLDPHSLELVDHYPSCIPCDSAYAGQSCLDTVITRDSIHFVFNNIYLPGVQQDGVTDYDSTQGFVRYRMKFGKKPKKLPFESSASIVFDKNPPIRTNSSRGYFKPGISPSVILGYNRLFNENDKFEADKHHWMIGAGISSYSPFKKYLQWELLFGLIRQPEQLVSRGPGADTVVNGQLYFQQNIDRFEKRQVIKISAVPLQLRYNIIDWVGIGAGTMLTANAVVKTSSRKEMFLVGAAPPPLLLEVKEDPKREYFQSWDIAAFADVQLGKVRVGPAFGLRFLHYFRVPHNRLLIYATWRL